GGLVRPMDAPTGSHFAKLGATLPRVTTSTNSAHPVAATIAPTVLRVMAPRATPSIPKQAPAMTVPRYIRPVAAGRWWNPCAASTPATVPRPRPKMTAANTAPNRAMTATLTANSRARCGVVSRAGMMVRCRNSPPAGGGEDAKDQHGHDDDRPELEHLIGLRDAAHGVLAGVARHRGVDEDAADGDHGRDRDGDRNCAGGEELPDFCAGEPHDGVHAV